MGYPLKKILASLSPGPRPPIFIGVAEPLLFCETPGDAMEFHDATALLT